MAVGFSALLLISGVKKKRDGWSVLKIELGFVLCGIPLAEEQCVKMLHLVTALE